MHGCSPLSVTDPLTSNRFLFAWPNTDPFFAAVNCAEPSAIVQTRLMYGISWISKVGW